MAKKSADLQIFAYYYLWYRGLEKRKNITWNREYPPALGLYNSDDPNVLRQHLLWASEYGIDGFLVEWYGNKDEDQVFINDNLGIMRGLLREFTDFRYAVFYDQMIRFGSLDFGDPDQREDFLLDIETIASENFRHPNYWFIDDRPVIVIYLTRASKGGYGALLQEARERIARASGYSPFIIGDDVWWNKRLPNVDVLDAVTAFNLHTNDQMEATGGQVRMFIDRSVELLDSARRLAKRYEVGLIPGIGHAYNDEHVRQNRPIMPTWKPGEMPEYRQDMIYALTQMAGLFDRNDIVKKYNLAPIFINSFNEWPERTSIEPSAEIEAYNALYDFTTGRQVVLPAPGYQYLQGIREARIQIQQILDT